ncbi:MAG: hypothetical protein C0478_08965 [Planctomyces sp.]|nr:hypothetical protein [Planctomyces sp.]
MVLTPSLAQEQTEPKAPAVTTNNSVSPNQVPPQPDKPIDSVAPPTNNSEAKPPVREPLPSAGNPPLADPSRVALRKPLPVAEIKKNWTIFSVEKATSDDVWKVQKAAADEDSELICLGKPFGYLQSPESFADFDLGFEWKYPEDPNGNSGLLVYTDDEEKIWPRSIQVQLHTPTAGSIFPASGATTDTTANVKGLSRAVGEWNSCTVSSRRGKLTVTVNGTRVGEVVATDRTKGRIALQSEGSAVHFRRFWMNTAPMASESEPATVPPVEAPRVATPEASASPPIPPQQPNPSAPVTPTDIPSPSEAPGPAPTAPPKNLTAQNSGFNQSVA